MFDLEPNTIFEEFDLNDTVPEAEIAVLLLDENAQQYGALLSENGIEFLVFDEDSASIEDKLLVLIGNFDSGISQQALEKVKKFANGVVIAVQLGQSDQLFGDCTFKINSAAKIIGLLKMFRLESDHDYPTVFCFLNGKHCDFFVVQGCGKNRIEQIQSKITPMFSKINQKIDSLIITVQSKDLEVSECHTLKDSFEHFCEDDARIACGISDESIDNYLTAFVIMGYS